MENTKKFRRSNQQVSTSLSGEAVVLNHEKGMYFTLNEVGTFLWEHLENNQIKTFGELKNVLLNEFEVDEITCENDLKQLLTDLINEKLVDEVS